jgi:hypothetical protein
VFCDAYCGCTRGRGCCVEDSGVVNVITRVGRRRTQDGEIYDLWIVGQGKGG